MDLLSSYKVCLRRGLAHEAAKLSGLGINRAQTDIYRINNGLEVHFGEYDKPIVPTRVRQASSGIIMRQSSHERKDAWYRFMDRVRAFKNEYGIINADIAKGIGRTDAHISKSLRLWSDCSPKTIRLIDEYMANRASSKVAAE